MTNPQESHSVPKSLRIALHGQGLLTSPRFNKGTAFTLVERTAFGLEGRLPHRVNTLDDQCKRAYDQLQARAKSLDKNTFLQSLKAQNWTLYYALLSRNLVELVPIIYTPTEAKAVAGYSHLFRRSEGLFLAYPDKERMEQDFLEQIQGRDVQLVVCTDSGAILGIGDQGVGGIGIATAKSTIYTAFGGLDPVKTLSVVLDAGTNNKKLLDDPLYVGWPNNRIEGKDYDEFVDQFVQLVRKHLPNSLLHFEDFGVKNARRFLNKYKESHAVFNDDIQGTGAVTLACVISATLVSRAAIAAAESRTGSKEITVSKDRLCDQRYVIFGAGSAGMGIATQLRAAIMVADGLSKEEATKRFWLVDKDGLIIDRDGNRASYDDLQKEFARPGNEEWKEGKISLLMVVKRARPTVVIGCSTVPGAFDEELVRTVVDSMDSVEMPLFLPLSNPVELAEGEPKDIIRWARGRALVATGSPFSKVELAWLGKSYEIAQCNNALIYPGLGLGSIVSQSRVLTDSMLMAGAKKLAELSPAFTKAKGYVLPNNIIKGSYEYYGERLLPDVRDAPQVNFEIGVAVAVQAIKEGSAGAEWAKALEGEADEMIEVVVKVKTRQIIWTPVYHEYEYDENGLKDV